MLFFTDNANSLTKDSYCPVSHTDTQNKTILKDSILTKMLEKVCRHKDFRDTSDTPEDPKGNMEQVRQLMT